MAAFRTDLGYPVILEFRGPDTVRFLNGQMTQDVTSLDGTRMLPSCVTDAKGKLQFRVHLMELKPGVIWVTAPGGTSDELEARLTRYLIADDVEVTDRTGEFQLYHLVGADFPSFDGTTSRKASRFGAEGLDLWIPVDYPVSFPDEIPEISDDELEDFRIGNGVPAWGRELTEGILPPEAKLEPTDISYHKGCYIGQEVISRIKSAGKVNHLLVRLQLAEDVPVLPGDALVSDEAGAGKITSVSPVAAGGVRNALGFLKRSADPADLHVKTTSGIFEVKALE